jgi:hypothetical protein
MRVLWVAMIFAVFTAALIVKVEAQAPAMPDHIVLTWSGDPHTTQTITWRTRSGEPAGEVQYAEAPAEFSRNPVSVKAQKTVVSGNLGIFNLNSAVLTGLKPGMRYYYRVGEDKAWSEMHSFITESAGTGGFKFLVFGDSQSINYNVWGVTLHTAYRANPGAAFFINVGDLVDNGQDYAQWDGWFDAAKGVIDTIPAMPVTGNHEMYTPKHWFSLPVGFTTQLKLPGNGPDGLKGQVYSFDYGNVHFIMLDSQFGEEDRFIPGMIEKEKRWLAKDLAATDKKWKLVFFHKPPFGNRGAGDAYTRRFFVPLFDKYHADVVFNGHEHDYAHTYPLVAGEVAGTAAQGTIYVTAGRSGSKTYRDSRRNQWDAFFYNPLDEPDYLAVEIRGDRLTVQAFKQNGMLIDSWTVLKAS